MHAQEVMGITFWNLCLGIFLPFDAIWPRILAAIPFSLEKVATLYDDFRLKRPNLMRKSLLPCFPAIDSYDPETAALLHFRVARSRLRGGCMEG
jgi:hypothetical protein